jgi:hypothetical protein
MTTGIRSARAVVALVACAVVLATGCSSGQPPASGPTAPGRPALAARYLAIAQPANRRLDADFDGLDDHDHDDLHASAAYLRDAAATERRFDVQLLRLPLLPAMETVARLMAAANQSRALLTDQAAGSTSLAQLRGYEPRLTAANASVEEAVRVIRDQLGLPPPNSS